MLTSGAFGYIADYLLWWTLFLSLVVHTWCFFRFFPRAKYRRCGLLLGNLLIFLCLLGTAGIAGESYFRFLAVQTDPFGVSLPARRWFALYTDLNTLGFRDREWSVPKPAGLRRVAFVGDSFTYGWGIEDPANRFTDLIQGRLDTAAPGRVEVMNVAKPGWSTADQLKHLPGLIERYRVDEVVLCYVINDIEELIPVSDDFNPTRPPEPKLFNPDASCLLDYLYRRIYVPRVPSVRGYTDWLSQAYEDPKIWPAQRQSLQQMAEMCSRAHVRFRVAVLPYIQLEADDIRHRRMHAQVVDYFESIGVETIDLAPAISLEPPGSLVVNALDAHPNVKAHALFADAMWRSFFQRTP